MENYNTQTGFFKDEISLKELYQKIKQKCKYLYPFRRFILISIIFGIILGFWYFKLQKIKYKAEINFVMEEGQNSISAGSGLASQLGLNLGGSKSNIFSGETFFAFMKSRFLVQKVLLSSINIKGEEISFIEYYIKTFGLRNSKTVNPVLKNFIFKPNIDKDNLTIDQMRFLNSIYSSIIANNLEVKPKDKKTAILTIEFVSENELFSKHFCEKIAEVASDFYVETANKKARLNLDILQKQTDSIRQELNLAMKSAAVAMDQVFNLNPSVLVNKIPSTKKQIDVQANTAILTQLVTNLESAKVSLRKETPLIQIIDAPVLPLDEIVENKYLYIFLGGLIGLITSSSFFLMTNKYRK